MIFVLCLLGLSMNVVAQYKNLNLISTAGDYYQSNTISISWSLGEITTETYTSSNTILTQGFQQSLLTPIGINEKQKSKIPLFFVYPNPTDNQINILLNENSYSNNYPNQYSMYNIQGELLLTKEITSSLTLIDVQSYQEGVYFLRLFNIDFHYSETVIIQKIY